jgi:hypothetical protein
MSESYTTLTVAEYNRIAATIRHLRRQLQNARQMLEIGSVEEALEILKFEDENLGAE